VHEGIEIEGGVEGVGEVVEEVDLEGLDADFGVGGVRVEELGGGRAIVAFEMLFVRLRGGGGGTRAAGFDGGWHPALRMILPGG
jgi:hypothetical protein